MARSNTWPSTRATIPCIPQAPSKSGCALGKRNAEYVAGQAVTCWRAAAYSALAGVVAARQDGSHSNAEQYGAVATWFGVATINGIGGAWYLLNPGPVESALHDYERSSGHIVTDGAGAGIPQFRLGSTPSGFMAALSGTF
jgi:hypothetical protein